MSLDNSKRTIGLILAGVTLAVIAVFGAVAGIVYWMFSSSNPA